MLSLIIALVSVVSLTYKSVYEFYVEDIGKKQVQLEVSVLSAGTSNLMLVAKNNGTADAFLKSVRGKIKAVYESESGKEKNRNWIFFSYLPVVDEGSSEDKVRSAIIPSGEYRVIHLKRGTFESSEFDGYSKEKTKTLISLTPDVINLDTLEKSNSITPKSITNESLPTEIKVVYSIWLDCEYSMESSSLCKKYSKK